MVLKREQAMMHELIEAEIEGLQLERATQPECPAGKARHGPGRARSDLPPCVLPAPGLSRTPPPGLRRDARRRTPLWQAADVANQP